MAVPDPSDPDFWNKHQKVIDQRRKELKERGFTILSSEFECMKCGARVRNVDRHEDFHKELGF